MFSALTMLLPVEVSTRALKELAESKTFLDMWDIPSIWSGQHEFTFIYVTAAWKRVRGVWRLKLMAHTPCKVCQFKFLEFIEFQRLRQQAKWTTRKCGRIGKRASDDSKFLWLHPHATCKLIDVTTETLLPLISFRFYSMLYSNFVKAPPPTA